MAALRRVAADCGFARLADLRRELVERWMIDRTADDMAARTRNAFREAWVVFCNWCVANARLSSNPFDALSKANVKADRRRQRRALTTGELEQLLEVAQDRSVQANSGIHRGPRKGRPAPASRPVSARSWNGPGGNTP